MQSFNHRFSLFVCVLLLTAATPVSAMTPHGFAPDVSVDSPAGGRTESTPSRVSANVASTNGVGRANVVQTVTFHLDPAQPAFVEATVTYEIGSGVTKLKPKLLHEASLKPFSEHPGFETVGDGTDLRWDGSTRNPSFTLMYPVEQVDASGQVSGAATKRWALFSSNVVFPRFSARGGTPTLTRHYRLDGEGYSTKGYTYIGEYEAHQFTLEGSKVTFVVPNESKVTDADVEHVQRTLENAAAYFEPASEARTITLFTAMPPVRRGGQTSNYRKAAEYMWVNEATLTAADGQSTLVHEYVHTQQDFTTNCEMRWLVEGSAEYYGTLVPLERGNLSYDRFYERVSDDNYDGLVLTEQCAYSQAQYDRGSRVLAALDVRIRNTTDGERTLQDVLVAVNDYDDQLTYEAFQRIVERVAGEPMDDWLDEHVAGPKSSSVPRNATLFLGPDADGDGDGLTRREEVSLGTDPSVADTDRDTLSDGEERAFGSDPTKRDTDGDGLADPSEKAEGSDPTKTDTDGDGLNDFDEVTRDFETDPTDPDTDGDGVSDGVENPPDTLYVSDPTKVDSDRDGLDDAEERKLGTRPRLRDSDHDGEVDGAEVAAGTDPLEKPRMTDQLVSGITRLVDDILRSVGE